MMEGGPIFFQMFCRDSVGLGVLWVVGCLVISVCCICSGMCEPVPTNFKGSWISRYLCDLEDSEASTKNTKKPRNFHGWKSKK